MASLVFIGIATAVCVFFDAKSIGMGRVEPGSPRGLLDLPPLGWALACLLIWIIALPLYLVHRKRYRSQRSSRSIDAFSTEALEKLTKLRDRGVITEEEFQLQKRELLSD
jgi:uncharacterized membrane protein